MSNVFKPCASSALEFLVNEVVAHMMRTCPPEQVNAKLDALGMEIGKKLAERMTREKGRFASDLETLRFICKEFWTELSGKTADGLRTDKKGTFQVEDKSFRFLKRISAAADVNVNDEALKYAVLPCGIIKGALEMLGFDNTQVKCQIVALPHAKFTVTIAPRA